MKARHVTAILTSAYVLILLASSPAIIRTAVAQSATNPPTMTDELMSRLVKYTRSNPDISPVAAKICKILNLCDGTKDMPLRLAKGDSNDGLHYFGIPAEWNSNDIPNDVLIVVKRDTIIEFYLTDKSCKLRAAGAMENGNVHLITNEKAAERFKTELALWVGEAGHIPPSGIDEAGDKK